MSAGRYGRKSVSGWHYPERFADGNRNHFVYYVYDRAGEVIYIGCTRNLDRRWSDHKYFRQPMQAEAVRVRVSGPYDYKTARRIEKSEQYRYRPRYDARHPDGWSERVAAQLATNANTPWRKPAEAA